MTKPAGYLRKNLDGPFSMSPETAAAATPEFPIAFHLSSVFGVTTDLPVSPAKTKAAEKRAAAITVIKAQFFFIGLGVANLQ